MVIGLDINGTVMEGDSLSSGESNDMSLTVPAIEFLNALEKTSARLVFYTFGRDFDRVLESLPRLESRRFPPENFFFISRALDSDEVWAFPMPPSKHVEYGEKDNPIINVDVADVKPLDDMSEYRKGADAYRFKDSEAFGRFIDTILLAGDAVLRSSYAPGHPHFRGRKDGARKCKILRSSKPVLAFDDHAEDWEVGSQIDKIVEVVSPGKAGSCEPTNFVARLNDFVAGLESRTGRSRI